MGSKRNGFNGILHKHRSIRENICESNSQTALHQKARSTTEQAIIKEVENNDTQETIRIETGR